MLLKGTSGFIGHGIHVSAPYDCNGFVFVEWHYRWGDWWKRMTKKRAEREGRTIITCCKCSRPAVQLDHHWPYMSDYCLCAEHQKEAG